MTRLTKLPEAKEDHIELSILQWLEFSLRIKTVWKNDIKGFYNKTANAYFKNKNPYIRKGISDISFLKDGQFVCIEVKRPSEMKFFIQPMETLKLEFARAKMLKKTTADKYEHAMEQQLFLRQIREQGGIAFFACSADMVKEKLIKQGFKF